MRFKRTPHVSVSTARYALGVVSLLIVCGSMAVAAVTLRRRFFGDWSGALARLVEGVIGVAILVAILEALGTLGLFRLGFVDVACGLLAGGVGLALRRSRPRPVPGSGPSIDGAGEAAGRPGASPRRGVMLALAALAVLTAATAIAEWASMTAESYDVGMRGFDTLWYHLPWAASFAQTGHITPLRFTDVEYLTAFYPATAELLHGLGIVLLARDTLSPAFNLLWLGLVLLAAWCIGRPRGVGAATVLGAAIVMAAPMMYFSQAGSASNDVVGIFFLLASVALLVNGEGRTEATVLAGIAAGLALAVKLSLFAPALALTLVVLGGAPARRRTVNAVSWLGALLIGGGFWYVRNLIAVGNPLPWSSLAILPTPAAPLQQHTGFSVAHYLVQTRIWNHFFEPGLAAGLGSWWYVILGAAVVGPLLCLLPGTGRMVRVLGIVALLSLAAYLITPETAAGPAGDPQGFAFNLRYSAPVLALSLVVLPLAPVFAGARARIVLLLGLVAVLVATIARAQLWPGHHLVAALAVAGAPVVLGLIAGGLGWVARPGRRGRRSVLGARAALAVGAIALLGAGAAAGYALQRDYLRGRYAFHPGINYLGRLWARFRTVHHARVGVVGTFGGYFTYPLFGLDTSNRVQYIAKRGPHGSFTPIASCSEFRAAVNAGHFRYLITTPGRSPWQARKLSPSPESAWTASDPAAHLLFSQRAGGPRLSLYRLDAPLDPSGC